MQKKQREELAEKLIGSMTAIMRVSGAVFRDELEKYGATLPQLHLMKMVSFHEGTTVTELAKVLMVAPPTASRMIDNLCSRGLLAREKGAGDQRVTHVKLTGEGSEILREIQELQVSILLDLLEGEDEEELKTFIVLLDKFSGRWSEASGRKT